MNTLKENGVLPPVDNEFSPKEVARRLKEIEEREFSPHVINQQGEQGLVSPAMVQED